MQLNIATIANQALNQLEMLGIENKYLTEEERFTPIQDISTSSNPKIVQFIVISEETFQNPIIETLMDHAIEELDLCFKQTFWDLSSTTMETIKWIAENPVEAKLNYLILKGMK